MIILWKFIVNFRKVVLLSSIMSSFVTEPRCEGITIQLTMGKISVSYMFQSCNDVTIAFTPILDKRSMKRTSYKLSNLLLF